MKRLWCGLLLSLSCALSLAQSPAFTLDIQAPDAVRQLLGRHLEIQRYEVLADLSDAELQRLMFGAQVQARDLVATLGYFSPDVAVRVERGAQPNAQRVVVLTVEPGAPTQVSQVRLLLEGPITTDPAGPEPMQLIKDSWTLPVGMPFTQAQWDSAKQQLLKKFIAQRYPAAQVIASRADVQPDLQSAELEVRIDSGPAYFFGGMQVQGVSRYSSVLVERLARLEPGTEYVQSELVDAQQRLTDSGYFDSAYLSLDLESDPAHATVTALVKEASMQKLVYGIGVSTDTGLRLSAEHTHNQVPGIGWRAINKITADRDTSAFSSDWTSKPDASQWRWAVSALLDNQRIGEIDVVGQRYRTGRFLTGQNFDQSYYLQFDRSDVTYRESNTSEVNEAISANYAFTYRQFDSMPFPTDGWALGGELSAGTTLGPVAEPFSRVLLGWRDFLPLGASNQSAVERQRAGRFAVRAQVGTVVVNNPNAIPFTQLFLAGGDNSVRGYEWQSIGVTRDGEITAESGRYLATGSVEWQRPIVVNGLLTDWESAVFVDTGAVANEPNALDFKVGVGVGARWKSPIGPLQADLAYGVAVQKLRLHLSVGFVF